MTIAVRYTGSPRPVSGAWGEVGWEELTDGSLCANQPNGAASWFPCDDHPSCKAPYRIRSPPTARTTPWPTGRSWTSGSAARAPRGCTSRSN